MSKIRVFIVDDHTVLRAGLKLLINGQLDLEVVGEASGPADGLKLIRDLRPDVITLDLSMAQGGGLKMLDEIRSSGGTSRVLVLTMHDDPAYFRTAMNAGASGYVVKTAADSELLSAIRAVHYQRMFISMPSQKPEELLTSVSSDSTKLLSDREQQVLVGLAKSYTNKEIGEQISLSVKTIETYRARIAAKLQLRSRAEIVRNAIAQGLPRSESIES
jgi:DNA-binding NarL/FixJ family response regulator